MPKELYHYTCDHGWVALGVGAGLLLPAWQLTTRPVPWPGHLVWLTDLQRPQRRALGLTMEYSRCDRTVHRYRVTDAAAVQRWVEYARALSRTDRDSLELAPGAYPMHWWVSTKPVPVVYDP